MDCNEARTVMQAAIDDGVRHAALDEHLAHCAECRTAEREMQSIAEALHQLAVETESIRSARFELSAKPRRAWWVVLLRAAAMIALAMGTIWLVSRPWSANERMIVEVDPGLPSIPEQEPIDSADVKPPVGITLQGESSRDLMAVAARSADSGVQMYWLYPKLSRVGSDE